MGEESIKANKIAGYKRVKRLILLWSVAAVLLIAGGVVTGTLAWLTAESDPVENVFTTSDIDVTLEESEDLDLKMIPGWTVKKDPKVSVTECSEDCYLFVKVEETGVSFKRDGETMPSVYAFGEFLTYEIAEGWTKLEDGVYYKIFDCKDTSNTNEKGTDYFILKNNQVTVLETVTKEMMTDLKTYEVNPKLSFTAYAVQLYKNNAQKFQPQEAWEKVASENPNN